MILEVKNVSKSFRNKSVLKDISFSVNNGSCIGILGSNGAGKSTLLSILAGIQNPDSGSIVYNGVDLLKDQRTRSMLVGYVPQGTPLIPELNARDNLRLWYSREELEQELTDGLLKLLGIDAFISTPVRKMSGGMKKRLSIGCAVSGHPPILLLDEPTAALDLVCKRDISAYLTSYKEAGGILILTTHDTTELALCDQCFIIKNGELCPYTYDGDVNNLIDNL